MIIENLTWEIILYSYNKTIFYGLKLIKIHSTYTSIDDITVWLSSENLYEFLHQYLDRSKVESNTYQVKVASCFFLL